jgi:hypothetical protein
VLHLACLDELFVKDQPAGWGNCLNPFGERFEIDLSLFELSDEANEIGQIPPNKGEAHNALARAVCFNRLGENPGPLFENQRHRASGLNLLVAAITLWNTIYLERVTEMMTKSLAFDPALLQHVSPLGWEHVNLTGDYTWHTNKRVAKGGRIRTVAVPIWVKQGIEAWMAAAKIDKGRLLLPLSKSGKIVGDELGDWAIWSVVEQSSKQIGIEHFGAHDLRRTCAKLCRKSGGDLEQIKFLLGHSSIQTTERYLGSEQEIEIAVNDNLGL